MDERTITTIGTGRVTVTANRLRVSLGVEARADGAARALQGLWSALDTLQRVLDEHGVTAADRQTASLALHEAYRNDGTPDGYQSSCQVTATLADPAAAAAVLDAVITTVGDAIRLHGTTWVADPSPLAVSAARQSAVADAVDQAHQLAIAARVTLGEIVAMREPVGAGAPGPLPGGPLRMMAMAAPDLDPGQSTHTVTVEVVHRIA
jgi:uncharacterized protein YggE